VIRTLRARLTIWYLAILGSSLAIFSALLYATVLYREYRHHDPALAAEADHLRAALTEVQPAQDKVTAALSGAQLAPEFALIRDQTGAVLYRSPFFEAAEPDIGRHEVLAHVATTGSRQPQFFTVELERLGLFRFICVPLGRTSTTYLQLGTALGDVSETVRSVAVTSLLLVPMVLILTSFGGHLIARRALAPIQTINETVRAIQATDLQKRIHVQPRDEEVNALVATLNQLLGRLEGAFVSLREFSADASHQLQTPLTVMKGSLEMALAGERDALHRGLLNELIQEIDAMSAVITDLRALSLADARPVKSVIDLSELCREASEIVSALGELQEVEVRIQIDPGIKVAGDSVRLKQVVLNLGENAVKYTGPNGRVTIQLRSDRQSDEAVIEVGDNGPGISDDHVRRIFDRFYRGTTDRMGIGGTGLGLAIVKRIVEAHEGTIRVTSHPGQGSAFQVRLPMIAESVPDEALIKSR
jgi:signal transduction histidine kinase